jgi:hypothetical protein
MNLEELVIECIKNGIRPCCVDYDKETNSLCYELDGFSKSGTAMLEKTATGEIVLKARYNQITPIETFEDIARVAYEWYDWYKDRSPFENPDSRWKPIFEKFGWL